MGYAELPHHAPAEGGRMQATIVMDQQELRATLDLLKDALAEFTKGIPNGVSHEAESFSRDISIAGQAIPAAPSAATRPQQDKSRSSGSFSFPQPVAETAAAAQQQAHKPMERPPAAAAAAPAATAAYPAVNQRMADMHLQAQQQQRQQQQQQQPMPQLQQQPPFQQQQQQWQQPQQQPQQQQQQQQPAARAVAQPPPRIPKGRPVRVEPPAEVHYPPRYQQTIQPQQQRFAAPPPEQQQQLQPPRQQPMQAPVAAPVAAPVVQQQQQRQPPAAGFTSAYQAALNAGPGPASSQWAMAYATDPEEHGSKAVSSLAYAPALSGLPGGDGHSGWLVSCSKGVINLWETNRAAAGEESVLLCMHSQAVDLTITKLVLEPDIKLLFGAAIATSDATECVSVHSLDVEVGLLAGRYKFAPPPDRARSSQRMMQQVASLHGMTPGLRQSVMASFGDRLLMFEAKSSVRANTVVHNPTFHFVAHQGSVVTALTRPREIEGCCNLISGAQDGKVHIWDLKTPPKSNQPAMRLYRHTKNVTGLAQVTDDRLVSSSMDGTVLLWDLRSPSGPLFTNHTPGGAGVLRIAQGPWGDMVAVSTAKGLHSVELFDFDAPMTNIAPFPLDRPYTDLVFSAVTHDLYAGSSSGAIHVFSRKG